MTPQPWSLWVVCPGPKVEVSSTVKVIHGVVRLQDAGWEELFKLDCFVAFDLFLSYLEKDSKIDLWNWWRRKTVDEVRSLSYMIIAWFLHFRLLFKNLARLIKILRYFTRLLQDIMQDSCPGWGADQHFCLIRLSRPKLSLIRLSRRKITQIRVSRPKLPLIRLSRHKRSLIRLFRRKAFWSDHLQTMVQTQIQNIAQTLIRIWSDSSAPETFVAHLWSSWSAFETGSGQTQVRSK